MAELDGKVAVVTGGVGLDGASAGGGMGSAVAEKLASEGAIVLVADIADEAGHAFVAALTARGLSAEYVHCDVTVADDLLQAVERATRKYAASAITGAIVPVDAGFTAGFGDLLGFAPYGVTTDRPAPFA